MNIWIFIGGPIVATLTVGFLVWSGILVFGEVGGLEHQAGVERGGSFITVQETESGSFSDVEGLDMEIEQEPIEYREGDEITSVRKLNGLNKYTNITLRWPTGFDTGNWKFIFDEKNLSNTCPDCKLAPQLEEKADAGVEMHQIDPPVLVIPAR